MGLSVPVALTTVASYRVRRSRDVFVGLALEELASVGVGAAHAIHKGIDIGDWQHIAARAPAHGDAGQVNQFLANALGAAMKELGIVVTHIVKTIQKISPAIAGNNNNKTMTNLRII